MPLTELPWPVSTERLSIRPSVVADAATVFAYRRLESVARWLPGLPDDAGTWAERWVEWHPRQLIVERQGVVVGDLYLNVHDGWSQHEVREQAAGTEAEIGYVLAPEHTGKGYAREAVGALLAIAFDGLGLRRVTAACFADNGPSWRLMEAVGMRREQHGVRDSLHRDGTWRDGLTYALLRDEWLSR